MEVVAATVVAMVAEREVVAAATAVEATVAMVAAE